MPLPPALLARPYFARSDAQDLAVSDRQLAEAVAAGRVVRLRRGWYSGRAVRWPSDLHTLRAALQVHLHPGQRASHHSALLLLGLPVGEADLSTVHTRWLGEGTRQRHGCYLVHEALGYDPRRDPVARAVVETALLDPRSALVAADHALRSGRMDPGSLGRWTSLVAFERGGAGARLVHRLADGGRESPRESSCAFTLHQLGYRTTPQVAVVGERGRYRVDLALDGEWVAVEYDGEGKYASGPDALLAEKRREDDIRSQGWEVVRVDSALLRDPARLRRLVEAARHRARVAHRGRARVTG